MFARLTIIQVRTSNIDETIEVFEEGIIPAAKAQKGYHAAYLLTDRKAGKCIAISLWDSEGDAVINEQSDYYKEQINKIAPFFTIAALEPIREGYEVSIQA